MNAIVTGQHDQINMLQFHFEAAQRRDEIQFEAAQRREENFQSNAAVGGYTVTNAAAY